MSRILLFGATGYTGEVTARELVRRGARPVLVARNAHRVEALAAELGDLDSATADATDAEQVADVVEAGDVLVSTVGPFLRWGEPAVRAAAEAGAHYLDSTGEGPFIRRVFDRWGPVAERNGSTLLSAFGFDFVPGALAGALALEEAGEAATAVDVAYFVKNVGTSGGTRASVAGVMLEDGFAYRGGRVQTERGGRRVRTFDVGGRSLTGASVPGAEHFALPQVHPGLRDVGVFLGFPPAVARGMGLSTILATPVRRIGPLKSLAGTIAAKAVKGSTGGPDAEARALASVQIVGEARDRSGKVLATVRLTGPDPYDLTAALLAWGAMTAADGGLLASGAQGPVSAYGLYELARACAEMGLVRAD